MMGAPISPGGNRTRTGLHRDRSVASGCPPPEWPGPRVGCSGDRLTRTRATQGRGWWAPQVEWDRAVWTLVEQMAGPTWRNESFRSQTKGRRLADGPDIWRRWTHAEGSPHTCAHTTGVARVGQEGTGRDSVKRATTGTIGLNLPAPEIGPRVWGGGDDMSEISQVWGGATYHRLFRSAGCCFLFSKVGNTIGGRPELAMPINFASWSAPRRWGFRGMIEKGGFIRIFKSGKKLKGGAAREAGNRTCTGRGGGAAVRRAGGIGRVFLGTQEVVRGGAPGQTPNKQAVFIEHKPIRRIRLQKKKAPTGTQGIDCTPTGDSRTKPHYI